MDCKAGDGENPPSSQDVKAAIKEKSFPIQRAGGTGASEDL